jgi:hypothetical protein
VSVYIFLQTVGSLIYLKYIQQSLIIFVSSTVFYHPPKCWHEHIDSFARFVSVVYVTTEPLPNHRNQTISKRGAYIISRRPSHGHLARRCCPQAFLRIFSEVTYIRTVGNSTLSKIYTLPNHTITIGVCILETQLLGLLYGGGASFVQKWSMTWMSANI